MCDFCYGDREVRDETLYLEWAESYLAEQGVTVTGDSNLEIRFSWVWEGCCELCRSEVEEMEIIFNGTSFYPYYWPDL